MSLPLTPARLAAVYESLRAFPPFDRMRLPPASEVRFKVTRHPGVYGRFVHWNTGQLQIEVSARNVGHFTTVAQTMAHEMIHLFQALHRKAKCCPHNAEFRRIAERVCKRFGWDVKTFV